MADPKLLQVSVLASLLLLVQSIPAALGDAKNGRLDLYFIDTEGGAATLFVTPAGESILIDSGYPDNHGRDLDRIIHVRKMWLVSVELTMLSCHTGISIIMAITPP